FLASYRSRALTTGSSALARSVSCGVRGRNRAVMSSIVAYCIAYFSFPPDGSAAQSSLALPFFSGTGNQVLLLISNGVSMMLPVLTCLYFMGKPSSACRRGRDFGKGVRVQDAPADVGLQAQQHLVVALQVARGGVVVGVAVLDDL